MTRVLVVDDDADIRQVIAYALGDEGYEVDQAQDGRTAMELVSQRHPDIIVLDMRMPGMDGWEFTRLYEERYGQRASIIVVTAAQDADQRRSDVNAVGYLSKPFDLDVLIEQISAMAKGHRTDQGDVGT
jgi:DNA-binding response OmpR family regulator